MSHNLDYTEKIHLTKEYNAAKRKYDASFGKFWLAYWLNKLSKL